MPDKTKGRKAAPTDPTTNQVSAEEVRDRLGDYLGRVEFGREEIIITRHGKPAAKLVPIAA